MRGPYILLLPHLSLPPSLSFYLHLLLLSAVLRKEPSGEKSNYIRSPDTLTVNVSQAHLNNVNYVLPALLISYISPYLRIPFSLSLLTFISLNLYTFMSQPSFSDCWKSKKSPATLYRSGAVSQADFLDCWRSDRICDQTWIQHSNTPTSVPSFASPHQGRPPGLLEKSAAKP